MIAILKNAIARLVCRYKGHHIHHIEVWLEPRLVITFCRRCGDISMSILCAHSAHPKIAEIKEHLRSGLGRRKSR